MILQVGSPADLLYFYPCKSISPPAVKRRAFFLLGLEVYRYLSRASLKLTRRMVRVLKKARRYERPLRDGNKQRYGDVVKGGVVSRRFIKLSLSNSLLMTVHIWKD